jgi:adenylosuccinate lyase
MHERIRKISMKAWEEVLKGNENPIITLLSKDEIIGKKLSKDEIQKLLDPYSYVGNAKEKIKEFLGKEVKPILEKYKDRIKEVEEKIF